MAALVPACLLSPHALADGDVGVGSGAGQFGVHATETEGGASTQDVDVSDGLPDGTYHVKRLCTDPGTACASGSTCPDGSFAYYEWIEGPGGEILWSNQYCASDHQQSVTPSLVASAFQRIPLPASPLNIQPPNGRTLVNFDTNFFTEDQSFDRTVRLLGRRIDLHITVSAYTWHFDDGSDLTTEKPGAPYPHLQITHNYLQTGDYGPTLDTTYVADYRVDGGAWQTVPGSVTIEGSPEQLTAVEARPVLVGYGS